MAGDGYCVRSLAVTYRHAHEIHAHAHPWGQLIYGRHGVMRVQTCDRVWLVPSTRAVWLPPKLTHAIAMRGEVAMRTLYIAPEFTATLPLQPVAMEVVPLLRELILHTLAIGMLHPDEPAHARLAAVLIDCIGAARAQDLWLPLPADKRARAVADRLQSRPQEHTDLATLVRESGASLRQLQRLFPAETGLALDAWRQKARLIHAAAALSAGASVTNAALDCGYESASAFISAFRKQFGITPGRYRH